MEMVSRVHQRRYVFFFLYFFMKRQRTTTKIIFPAHSLSQLHFLPPDHSLIQKMTAKVAAPAINCEVEISPNAEAIV